MKQILKRTLSVFLVLLMLGGVAPIGALTLKASAKTIAQYKQGDIIEFGWYPQSKVKDSTITAQLNAKAPAWDNWTSYGYYSGSGTSSDGQMTPKDYMRYVDIMLDGSKYRGVKFTSYRPYWTGDTSSTENTHQDDNGYYTNTVYWFKFEPLQWRVLDPATGLVLSETIIDSQAYNNYILESGKDAYGHTAYWGDASKTHYANNYAESSIRQWLNNDFLGTAFSAKQQNIIAFTQLENKAYSTEYSKYDSASTNDKIFFLTYSDVLNTSYGFSSSHSTYDINRRASGTDYAKCQGLRVATSTSSDYLDAKGNKCSYWWLRSAGYYSYDACNVRYDGYVNHYYYVTDDTYMGVRPAFKLNLTSDIFQSDVSELVNGTYDLYTSLSFSQKNVIKNSAEKNEEYRRIYFEGFGTPMDGENNTPKLTIPGLCEKDNMVPQGIALWKEKGAVLISAYSPTISKPSVIYALNHNTGEFTGQYTIYGHYGHVGGIAVSGNNLYLSNGSSVSYIPLRDFTDGDAQVQIAGSHEFSCMNGASVSYASVTDNRLFFGNFYHPDVAEYKKPIGARNSAVFSVDLGNAASSEAEWEALCSGRIKQYNIPNEISKVQGATVVENRLYLNCSYGRTKESTLYVSDPLPDYEMVTPDFSQFHAVKGVPMMEDMEYSDGYLYTLTESAAHNYMNSGDDKGKSKHPTENVWRIDCKELLSPNEYKKITFWDEDKENGICEMTGQLDVGFRDSWFTKSPGTYNPYLGTLCSDIVLLGYAPKAQINSGMANLGFSVAANLNTKNAGRDEVNNFIMTKPINGGTDLLVLVATIGSNDDQWYSNFDPNGTARVTGTSTDKTYHLGFLDAKEYMYNRIRKNYSTITQGYDKSHVKFLFTGHSRGAATANLLAAQFIDDAVKGTGMAEKDNIYAYTFATPNVGLKDKINPKSERYRSIFNFVNPEDFVTKVLPTDWDYARYGTTYVFPSKTNTTGDFYSGTYLKNVQDFYKNHTQKKYTPYQTAGLNTGEAETYAIMKLLTLRVKSTDDLYTKRDTIPIFYGVGGYIKTSLYDYFKGTLLAFLANMGKHTEEGNALMLLGVAELLGYYEASLNCPTVQTLFYDAIFRYFVSPAVDDLIALAKNPASLPLKVYKYLRLGGIYFQIAHQPETYCAYMNTMGAFMQASGNNGFMHTVNCPVDVEVYEKETGELVGKIVNNVVDETIAQQDNSVVMTVNGDSKMFWLPGNGDYEVKLIGNGEGTMDYTVASMNSDTGETERTNFFDVPITEGKIMTGEVNVEDFSLETYTLEAEGGTEIVPTETAEDVDQSITITTEADGNGLTTESFEAVSGDYVTVIATPMDEHIFTGWHEGDALVSTEAQFSFVVKQNRNLTASFAPCTHEYDVTITKEPTVNEEGEKTFTCKICKHSYTEPIPVQKRVIRSVELSGATVQYKSPLTLKPVVTADEGVKYTIVYSSSNPKVAEVDKDGNVTTHRKGTVTITCTATNNDNAENVVETTCKVTVKYAWWQILIRILLLGFLWY